MKRDEEEKEERREKREEGEEEALLYQKVVNIYSSVQSRVSVHTYGGQFLH